MAFKNEVVDRVPTYPGRIRLTPVSGQPDLYDMTRADSPITEGTPINKALFDQKAYTLTQNATVYVSTVGSDQTGDGTNSAPYATIQKAIDSLPKWLDGYMVTISIANGTYEEKVEIDGFRGGILVLGDYGRSVTVRSITISSSDIVRLNVNITYSSSLNGTPLLIQHGSNVQFGGSCTIDGASGNISGIMVESGSILTGVVSIFGDMDTTTIKNCKNFAIYATAGSKVSLGVLAGSGNGTGLYASFGGVISYDSRTMTATTANVTVAGGRIYSGAQTSVPNY